MNYESKYNALITEARTHNIHKGLGVSTHHIVPRCMNGSDDDSNLVNLTYQEHYDAHHYLTKIYPDNDKLRVAFFLMCNHGHYDRTITNEEYSDLRMKFISSILKPVSQFKLDGTKIARYESIQYASKETGINELCISANARDMTHHAGHFIWRFNDVDTVEPYTYINKNCKTVYQFKLDGTKVSEYDSAKIASKELGIDHSTICACAKRSKKSAGGFLWSYENIKTIPPYKKYKIIYQFRYNGTKVSEYDSAKIASNDTGINITTIRSALSKSITSPLNYSHAKGFLWGYEDVDSVIPYRN